MKKFFTLIAMMFVAGATFAQDDVEWGDNLFENSDLEADVDYPWFHVKSNLDNPEALITTAVPVAGVGVNGSKGIKVVARGSEEEPAAQAWDSQFWIQVPTEILDGEGGTLEFGEQVMIEFDCRADWETIAGEEVEEVVIGTQGHNAPGSYRNNTGVGDVSFKKDWSHHVGVLAPDANPYSIAFNLCQGHLKDDVTFYIDNITIKRVKKNEEIIQYWSKLVTNGNFEGESTDNYVIRIYKQGDAAPEIEDGIGVDGSRGIKMVIPAKVEQDWDSQFFITFKEPLEAGASFKISFDYKASETPANAPQTQSHAATPGSYIHWACIGDVNFTEEWKTFNSTVSVSSDMSKSDNLFQTIAFNMARNDHEITYYFDNINVRILKEGTKGDVPEILELQETIDNLEGSYSNIDAPANSAARDAFREAYENAQNIVSALDQENAEKAMYALIGAESKFSGSVKDYSNLNYYINFAANKAKEAEVAGYSDLYSQIDAYAGQMRDLYAAEELTKESMEEYCHVQPVMDMVYAALNKETIKEGDDVTILLPNAHYDSNQYDWDNVSSVTVRAGVAERWHATFDMNKTLKNLPEGAYEITLEGFQRRDMPGDSDTWEQDPMTAQLYANNAYTYLKDLDLLMEETGGDIPSSMETAAEYFQANPEAVTNTLNVVLAGSDEMKIGVKADHAHTWVIWDNFKIIYKGADANSLLIAVQSMIDAANEFKDGDDASIMTLPTSNALDAAIVAAEKLVATGSITEAQGKEAIDAIVNAMNDGKDNIKAYNAANDYYWDTFANIYTEKATDGEVLCTDAVKARADKADAKFNNDIDNMTTKEINALIDEMKFLADAMLIPAEVQNASASNSVDLTDFLVEKGIDVDFEDYAEVGANHDYPGWAGSKFGTGGGTAGPVGERWNQSSGFNTYVDLAGMPAGIYTLSCDGAYRTSLQNDYNRLQDASLTTDNEAFLYAQTSAETLKTALHNIAEGAMTAEECESAGIDYTANTGNVKVTINEEEVTYYFPDQLYTADQWMQDGKYLNNEVTITVPADGKLRIGVQRKGQSNDWCFVDNFKLVYYGPDPTAINSVVAPAVKGIYTISGVRVNSMNKSGLYIVNGKKVLVK